MSPPRGTGSGVTERDLITTPVGFPQVFHLKVRET